MEISQGNSLCSYLKQTKMSFLFSFIKLEDRRAEQVLWGKEGWYQLGKWGKDVGG
jgi:hypothetical protein